jgi:hypothetical protein
MKRISLLCLLALLATAGAATAGVDVSFGANVPVGDDGNLFVSISSRYFDREPRFVEDWQRRYYPDPDDLAVALFLSRHCDQDPEFIFNLRKKGVGWFEISNRCRVPVDAFFVTVRRDPGPPYGKAYGHWKKHKRDRNYVVVLSDDDVRHLVGARMIHEYYGVPYETAMKWRARDRDVRVVMDREYRQRHGGGEGRDGDDRRRETLKERGNGKSDDHEKSKGEGHKDEGRKGGGHKGDKDKGGQDKGDKDKGD